MRLLSITDKRLFNMYTGQTKEEEQDEKNSTQQTYLFTALRLIIHLHNLPDKAPCKKKKSWWRLKQYDLSGGNIAVSWVKKKKKKTWQNARCFCYLLPLGLNKLRLIADCHRWGEKYLRIRVDILRIQCYSGWLLIGLITLK